MRYGCLQSYFQHLQDEIRSRLHLLLNDFCIKTSWVSLAARLTDASLVLHLHFWQGKCRRIVCCSIKSVPLVCAYLFTVCFLAFIRGTSGCGSGYVWKSFSLVSVYVLFCLMYCFLCRFVIRTPLKTRGFITRSLSYNKLSLNKQSAVSPNHPGLKS